MRIGLFGGSFNPPHLGHLALAEHAYKTFGFDEVWLLVTPQNPEKPKAAAPFEHRCHLCELLAEPYPWLKLSTLEADSGAKDSFASVRHIQVRHPEHEFVWLMGTDNFKGLHMWEFAQRDVSYRDFINQIPLVIYARDLLTVEDCKSAPALADFQAAEQPLDGPWQPLPNWRVVHDFDHPASATLIRLGDEEHLAEKLAAYIKQHKLYGQS